MFAVALLLRAGWGTVRLVRSADPSALDFPDEQQYWGMAQSLRAGGGLTDELGFRATRMPLFPAVLSLFATGPHGVIAAKAFQWFVGAAGAALTAGVAGHLFGRRVGLLAGLIVAVDPFLVFFSSLLLTETGFVAALVGLWWLLAPIVHHRNGSLRRWAAVGLTAALCVYVRESSAGLVLLALGYAAAGRPVRWRTLAGGALAGGLVCVALMPWAARNRRAIGEWCWLTTRAGISLYDGVGPQATGRSDLGKLKQMPAVRGLSEVEWNRYFLAESWKAIQADPARMIRLAGIKLARLWNPFPNVESYQSPLVRSVSAAWSMPMFVLAVAGAWLLSKAGTGMGPRMAFFFLFPAMYFSALHSLFVGSVRYRLGATPLLEILAAVALASLLDRVFPQPTPTEPIVAE